MTPDPPRSSYLQPSCLHLRRSCLPIKPLKCYRKIWVTVILCTSNNQSETSHGSLQCYEISTEFLCAISDVCRVRMEIHHKPKHLCLLKVSFTLLSPVSLLILFFIYLMLLFFVLITWSWWSESLKSRTRSSPASGSVDGLIVCLIMSARTDCRCSISLSMEISCSWNNMKRNKVLN